MVWTENEISEIKTIVGILLKSGMPKSMVAKLCGVSYTSIRNWESKYVEIQAVSIRGRVQT